MNLRKQKPEIVEAYELYNQCKGIGYIMYKKQKGKETVQAFSQYPTGYVSLPEPGGMLDQPYRLMEFFDLFREAELHVVGT